MASLTFKWSGDTFEFVGGQVSRGFWNFKDIGRLNLHLCKSAGARLMLGAGIFVAGSLTADADNPVREIPLSAFEACVSDPGDLVEVSLVREEGLFRAANGERFFASDIHDPGFGATLPAVEGGDGARVSTLWALPLGPPNRWGLIPAWIVGDTGEERQLWQFEMLRQGAGQFAPRRANGACTGFLRLAEADARDQELGIWGPGSGLPIYQTAVPEALEKAVGEYVIARGRIVSLGKTRSTRYLNFGKYWKTDFTVTLRTSDEESFNTALVQSGWKIEALAGQVVELRGVVQLKDGPSITLTHPGQLLVVESKRAGRVGQDNN